MDIKDTGWNLETSYLELPEMFYRQIDPNPVSSPKLVIVNNSLAESLGLDIDRLKDEVNIKILSGNKGPQDNKLLAQAYAGHQFGHFTILGDGRAALIGEQITPEGQRFDIQLKGAGKTPYSRGGDGRAGLGQMLREYIISEAMYHLGIPTTRSLAVVATGDKIYRQTQLEGSILTRVAKSHIRVGTFEYAAKTGRIEDIKALSDYTIKRHYPRVQSHENPYLSLVNEVIKAQASLVSKWQHVGFIHGVMNTDNVSISGESIDYGPCAFMDTYDPATVFSSIDRYGRYAYGNQPNISKWNLGKFAETLLPLIDKDIDKAIELAQNALEEFDGLYYNNWIGGMRSKLGISDKEIEDESLIEELLELMETYKADYTNTFISLTFKNFDDMDLFKSEEFKTWNRKWNKRLDRQKESKEFSKDLMKKSNPSIIPRNHLVEEALDFAVRDGDFKHFHKLLDALSSPYEHLKLDEKYTNTPTRPAVPYKTYCGT